MSSKFCDSKVTRFEENLGFSFFISIRYIYFLLHGSQIQYNIKVTAATSCFCSIRKTLLAACYLILNLCCKFITIILSAFIGV